MRIAYCLSYLWNSGGVDRVITIKANYLADVLGYEVAIITTDQKDKKPYFPLSDKVKHIDLSINYTDTNKSFIGKMYNAFRKRILHKKRLEQVLSELNPDISIALTRRELSILYKVKTGGIKIVERHMNKDCRFYESKSSVERMLQRYLSNKEERFVYNYTLCVTLTNTDKQKWKNQDKVVVIPNPVTINSSDTSELTNKQVIAVGRITYEKGYDRLLTAWSLVEKVYPDWRLCIVGAADDIELARIKKLMVSLNLQTAQLLPPTNNVIEYYTNSSLLVLSSRYECMPLVLLEAMSCGEPCVSFDCECGPKDIIADGVDGLLVKNGDIKALADAMMRLIGDEQERKRMGANALIKSKQYSLPVIMHKWDNLFKEIYEQQ